MRCLQGAVAEHYHPLVRVAIGGAAEPPAPEVCRLREGASGLLQAPYMIKEDMVSAACSKGSLSAVNMSPKALMPHRMCVSQHCVNTLESNLIMKECCMGMLLELNAESRCSRDHMRDV